MNKFKQIASFLTLFFMANFFSFCSAETSFKSVTVEEFEQYTASDTSVIVLDVRRPAEFEEGHLPGAVNIDVLAADFTEKATTLLPAGSKLAVYCRSGRRSKNAASILTEKGYSVVELNTGILGWINAAKTITK